MVGVHFPARNTGSTLNREAITPISGVVVSVTGTTGPSASIRYTIRLNMPGGQSVEVANIRPSTPPMWEQLGLDVTPFPVGYKVSDAYLIGDTIKWHDIELPAIEDCDGVEPQPVREPDPLSGVVLGPDGQPTGGGTGGLGIGSGTFTTGTLVSGEKGEGTI